MCRKDKGLENSLVDASLLEVNIIIMNYLMKSFSYKHKIHRTKTKLCNNQKYIYHQSIFDR